MKNIHVKYMYIEEVWLIYICSTKLIILINFFNKIFALNIKNTDLCMLIVKESTWNSSKINKIINQLFDLHIECYNLQFQFNLCLWTSVFNVISHLLGTAQKSCLSPKPQAYCTNNRALSCTIRTNYYIQGWSSQKLHRVVCSGKKKKTTFLHSVQTILGSLTHVIFEKTSPGTDNMHGRVRVADISYC